jgi:hypothetical protein
MKITMLPANLEILMCLAFFEKELVALPITILTIWEYYEPRIIVRVGVF